MKSKKTKLKDLTDKELITKSQIERLKLVDIELRLNEIHKELKSIQWKHKLQSEQSAK